MNKIIIEKPVVLVRKYTDCQGQLASFPQCKVCSIDDDDNWFAFRDIYRHKSQLFRDDTWNMDHLVFDWLRIHKVEKIYYFERKSGKLYKITLTRIQNSLFRPNETYKEKLNNHTQYFIPRYLWQVNPPEKEKVLSASRKWIKNEIDVSWMETTYPRLDNFYIPYETKLKL